MVESRDGSLSVVCGVVSFGVRTSLIDNEAVCACVCVCVIQLA